jgi:SAM-dependent methyltransferase
MHKPHQYVNEPTSGRLDLTTPSVSRMYDYFLGGHDNLAMDRPAADAVIRRLPSTRLMALENRAFLGRIVRYLAGECGIRQFIDIGSGLPTQKNVHQVAQTIAPATRVVYIDNDPVVLSHARALLAENDNTAVITADLRDPTALLGHPALRRLIDPSLPVAVLMVAILHFITDEERPYGLLHSYRSWMPPGSYLAISHADRTDQVEQAARVYEAASSSGAPRSREEVRGFFGDFALVDPGLVPLPTWRPAGRYGRWLEVPFRGGVGCKTNGGRK